jgi:multidrug resistance efflux pump
VAEIRSSARDEARHEAARVAQEMAGIEQTIARLQDRLERTLARAPIGGLVRGLAVQRSGSLAQPGALLAEIVPPDAGLVVEARVAR